MEKDFCELKEDVPRKKKSSFYSLIALFSAIALFILSIQSYFYFLHPAPTNIPNLEEVNHLIQEQIDNTFSSHNKKDIQQVLEASRNSLKQVANFIVSNSCKKADRVCQSKALFYFVRDNIKYVPDDRFHDQLENPLIVLKTGGADCEDKAVLLAGLEKSIGNDVRLVFIPRHVYVQVKIPKYRSEKWLNLETTCTICQFAELPNDLGIQKKTYQAI